MVAFDFVDLFVVYKYIQRFYRNSSPIFSIIKGLQNILIVMNCLFKMVVGEFEEEASCKIAPHNMVDN